MDRFWLLTWTTYGQWLPGDRRGFVGTIRDADGNKISHNEPGTPYDRDVPALERAMRQAMLGEPILLTAEQSAVLQAQFLETASYRGWSVLAGAVMANHVHLVVAVPGDPEPETLLHSFKSYGSRALNRRYGKPPNGTWWTESGSKRKLPNAEAVRAAVAYVLRQKRALVVWSSGVVTDPARPVTDPARPVTDPARPVTDPARPVTNLARPVTDPARLVTDAARPEEPAP